jgi:hypothetical protein
LPDRPNPLIPRHKSPRLAKNQPLRRQRRLDLMRPPRRNRAGDKADQAVKHELGGAAVRPPRAIEEFCRAKRDDAYDQHPDNPVQSSDVKQNIVHRGDHQARHDGEQIAVLQRLEEDHEQLCDFPGIGLRPVAGHDRGRDEKQKAAEEGPEGGED